MRVDYESAQPAQSSDVKSPRGLPWGRYAIGLAVASMLSGVLVEPADRMWRTSSAVADYLATFAFGSALVGLIFGGIGVVAGRGRRISGAFGVLLSWGALFVLFGGNPRVGVSPATVPVTSQAATATSH